MHTTEAPLWDYLDACGFPFRLTRGTLVERFGYRPSGWSDGLEYIEPHSGTPFLPGLAHGLVCHKLPDTDMQVYASDFFTYVRTHDTAEANFAHALRGLHALFGDGRDTSSSNTLAQTWQMGFASLTATAFPPHLNTIFPANQRHILIPGSAMECEISIVTAWRLPLDADEKRAVATYSPLHLHAPGDPPRPLRLIQPFTHDAPPLPPGFGLSEDGTALLHVPHPNLVNILPLDWITSVTRISLLPARGGGEASILVYYRPSGQHHLPPHVLELAARPGDPFTYNDLARALGKKLDVPLSEIEQPNA